MRQLRFNTTRPAATYLTTLGGTEYRITYVWRDRLCGWYIDVDLADGTGVARGRRVAPGGVLVHDMDRSDPLAPAGRVLVAVGKDDYAREDLGRVGGVQVVFMSREEWDGYQPDLSEAISIT